MKKSRGTQLRVRVRPGAQLRLSLSGARFPCYDRNGHTSHQDPHTTSAEQRVATIDVTSVELDLPFASS